MTNQPNLFPPEVQPAIAFFVSGTPRTQGSGDRMVLERSGSWSRLGTYVDSSDKTLRDKNGVVTRKGGALKRWKANVRATAKIAMKEGGYSIIKDAPVRFSAHFLLARPRTVRRAAPHKDLDRSKLLRAVEDALEGVAYVNDAQICEGPTSKRYATGDETPGVQLSWSEVTHVAISSPIGEWTIGIG